MRSFATLLCLMVGFGGLARAQDIDIHADLLSPLGTQTSHKDDKVTAQVTSPDALKGDTLEGKVTDVRSASRLRGSSVLNFTFDTLRHAGAAELDEYARAGHFPPGNMGPKIESVLRFLRNGGKEAIITSCENLCQAVVGSAGTHMFPDRDRAEIERNADLENKALEFPVEGR